MNRMIGAAAVLLLAGAVAQGHFPFILPEPGGDAVKVVFSDELAPDPKVNIEKLAGTKLFVRDAAGKDTPLSWKKGEGFYAAPVPGSGPRVVYGVTDYGVLQKGDAKPFRLVYYPKALVGDVPVKAAAIGEPLKLEILAVSEGGKTRFWVVQEGKPAAELEYTVLAPGDMKKTGKTDKDGYTEAFDSAGRYGVYVRLTETKAGEADGKKFEETRHYASLVTDLR